MFLIRTNIKPLWLQEAIFDNIVYELDTSRNVAVRNLEKCFARKLQKSVSIAVSISCSSLM